MSKRPVCTLTVSFVFGLAFFFLEEKMFLVLTVILDLWMTVELLLKKRKKMAVLRNFFFAAAFLLGYVLAFRNVESKKEYQDYIKEVQTVTCQGKINQIEQKANQTYIFLKSCIFQIESKNYSCNSIMICVDSNKYPIGKTIVVKGTLIPFSEARNEGNFDEKAYYSALDVAFKVEDATVLGEYGKENKIRQSLFGLREHLKMVFLNCMNEKEAGVLLGMLFGDKTLLDKDLKNMYQRNGFSHVLCVSGLHISVIGMSLYRFLRKKGVPYASAGVCSTIPLLAFAEMSGFGVSAKRAVIMFVLMLLANWLGRAYDSLTALALAAFFLLFDNPGLFQYAGFLFSFFAVFGAVGIGQELIKIVKPEKKWKESVLLSLGIQLMTLPLTRFFYYEIPIYAMGLNLLLLPMMQVILYSGIVGGVAGLVCLFFGKCLLLPAAAVLIFYEKVLTFFSGVPYAYVVTGTMERSSIFVYYGILFVLLFLLKTEKKSKLFLGGILILFLILMKPLPKQERIDVLDVGQGDGIYFCTKNHESLFLDGGSSDVSLVGTYRILPFLKRNGVGKISYWFVSHTDNDHISGLMEAIDAGYPVEHVVFAKHGLKEAEGCREFLKKLEEHKIPVLFLEEEDCMYFGESSMTCLFPDADYEKEDVNARSMILRYESENFSAIFTGDISSEEEAYLLEKENIKEVSLYKAAHHGSKYSNSEGFLRKLSPRISVISYGKNNHYGHPGKEAVEHMKDYSDKVYETAFYGQITVLPKKNEVYTKIAR